MGAAVPKQYLDLAGRPVIDYSLGLFLDHPRISGVVVALDPTDERWPRTAYADHPQIRRADGGDERCHSVLNALDLVADEKRTRTGSWSTTRLGPACARRISTCC